MTTQPLMVGLAGYSTETFNRLKARRNVPDWSRGNLEIFPGCEPQHEFVEGYLTELFSQDVPSNSDYLYKPSIAITERFLRIRSYTGEPGVKIDDLSIEGVMYPTMALRGSSENLALRERFAATELILLNAIFVEIESVDHHGLYGYKLLATVTSVSPDGTLPWVPWRPMSYTWEFPGPLVGFTRQLVLKNDWMRFTRELDRE